MSVDTGFAGSAAAGGGGGTAAFARPVAGLDRLVSKEVSLGTIRDIPVDKSHIGLQIAPFMPVESDEVVFQYLKDGLVDGLSPARAEDAEAELAQKDDVFYGTGRASIIDWALKDRYSASDVTRYRDGLLVQRALQGSNAVLANPLNAGGSFVSDFNARVARHDALRRRKLDNRIEWLIQQSLWLGQIDYNDGKVKFSVNWGRPASQTSAVLPVSPALWDAGTTHDPVGDVIKITGDFYNTYGVHLTRAITSKKVLQTVWRSSMWNAMTGLVVGGTPNTPINPQYLLPAWNPQAAIDKLQEITGVTFTTYDGVYRTRAYGSTSIVNTRFSPENQILFLPDPNDLDQVDDTTIGFGKTLTAPHPEGNWTSGFYEWEAETHDPWMHVRGTGVKAFPVFPFLEYTATYRAIT